MCSRTPDHPRPTRRFTEKYDVYGVLLGDFTAIKFPRRWTVPVKRRLAGVVLPRPPRLLPSTLRYPFSVEKMTVRTHCRMKHTASNSTNVYRRKSTVVCHCRLISTVISRDRQIECLHRPSSTVVLRSRSKCISTPRYRAKVRSDSCRGRQLVGQTFNPFCTARVEFLS